MKRPGRAIIKQKPRPTRSNATSAIVHHRSFRQANTFRRHCRSAMMAEKQPMARALLK